MKEVKDCGRNRNIFCIPNIPKTEKQQNIAINLKLLGIFLTLHHNSEMKKQKLLITYKKQMNYGKV